jgi:Tol biopolymer transport system component/predicted Ser/Thr protein kinase
MESGTMLAHYRVAEMIGKGGMGEVYRAQDTKLARDVALKILPAEFAADRDRMARFDREAKLLASLHHPNIASIFGFETTDTCTFLVMEMVEGEDLSEALRSGALPVDEAVEIARQIAEGLEEAHEKGIVHRDLKPANVKRTPDGRVKVLDFGLARVFAGQTAGEADVSGAATMTAAMTQVGTIMGTAAYMSPEQARGKEVDRRADIWAFGVILFEMLTGKQLFVGETASDTLAGILKSDPDWDQLPAGLPFQVERVLRRCLEKDPRQRLRDIGEARVRLEDPTAESGMFSGPIAAVQDTSGRGRLGRAVPWALLALSLAALFWLQARPREAAETTTQHLAVPAPKEIDFHFSGSFPGLPVISPDGNRIAYSGISQTDNSVRLYVRDLDDKYPVALSDTRDAQYPFWSPDGLWLAYYVRSEGLLKIPVDGGPPQMVATASNGKGGSWNQMGEILFTTDYNTFISLCPATGGEARPVTDLEADEGFNSHRHPQFLPDGRHYLYFARGNGREESEIRFASLDGDSTKVVIRTPLMGEYASGYLVYISHGDLVAQPFDHELGELSGSPTPLVEDVMTVPGAAKGVFSVSQQGKLVFLEGEAGEEASLTWRERDGKEGDQISELARYDMVALSPDGRSAAVGIITESAGTWDIWVVDLTRNFATRFTVDPADDSDLVWSRDSRGLYFASDREGIVAFYYKEIGSPEPPREIFSTGENMRLWDVSADGRTIFYSVATAGTAWDLWSADVGGETEPRLLRATVENDVRCQLSPDEKWVTFASRESGQNQVYVAPWPAMSPITQVSTTTGTWSRWVNDGKEVIFQEELGSVVAVPMTVANGRMSIGRQETLFGFAAPVLESIYWDVSRDGQRFITVNTRIAASPRYVNLVVNWPRMLGAR